MGRRSKLTPQLQEKFVGLMRIPMTIEAAAGVCNVTATTIYAWLAKGREQTQGKFSEFAEAVEKARGEGEAVLISIVMQAAKDGEWTAAMTMLERMHAKRWARRVYKPEDEAKHDGIHVSFARPAIQPEAKGDEITSPSAGNGKNGED